MDWMMNRSPTGQIVWAFGMGALLNAIYGWPRLVGASIACGGAGIGLLHYFFSVREQKQ